MTRRRCILLSAGIGVACLGIVLGVLAMLPPQSGVTKANFDRIEKGMTLKAVNEIFGQESSRTLVSNHIVLITFKGWTHDDGSYAHVTFSNDNVTDMFWEESTETLVDKLRRWLHLPK